MFYFTSTSENDKNLFNASIKPNTKEEYKY